MRVKEWGREEEWITWMNKRCWSTGGEIRDCWLTTKAVYSPMQGTESQGKGLILFSSFWELSKTWIAFLVFPFPSPFPLSPFLPIVIRRSRSTLYLSVYHSIQWLPIASYLLLCIFYLVLYGYEKKKKSVSKLHLTFCDPMDCSRPGSSAHGISQARILEWVAISFSSVSSLNLGLLHWQADSLSLSHQGKHIITQNFKK